MTRLVMMKEAKTQHVLCELHGSLMKNFVINDFNF